MGKQLTLNHCNLTRPSLCLVASTFGTVRPMAPLLEEDEVSALYLTCMELPVPFEVETESGTLIVSPEGKPERAITYSAITDTVVLPTRLTEDEAYVGLLLGKLIGKWKDPMLQSEALPADVQTLHKAAQREDPLTGFPVFYELIERGCSPAVPSKKRRRTYSAEALNNLLGHL